MCLRTSQYFETLKYVEECDICQNGKRKHTTKKDEGRRVRKQKEDKGKNREGGKRGSWDGNRQ